MEHHRKEERGNKLESARPHRACKLCEKFWIILAIREKVSSKRMT